MIEPRGRDARGGLPREGARPVADVAAERAQLRRLEIVSVAEATTLLVLVVLAVPLKHLGGWELGVKVMGPVHGLAFVAYAWTAVQTVAGGGWSRGEIARLFGFAFVPLGGFLNLGLLSRRAADLGREGAGR